MEFKIDNLDIRQSYFFGQVERDGLEYNINIQNQRRGKVLRLPFGIAPGTQRPLVRLAGPGSIRVEDRLPYCGESEWVEIDSDEIAYFVADHQDRFDTLEVLDC